MKMEELEKLRVDLNEFLEYINYMNDEFGEYCLALYHLGSCTDGMSKEFAEVYIKEVEWNLAYIKRNTEWVEQEEAVVKKYKELEWLSYD